MRWAIIYDQGRVHTSADGRWRDAPAEGVLAVATLVDGRYDLHLGADHYQLEDDGTVVMREASIILRAVGLLEMSPVKFGRYSSNTMMRRAAETAEQLRREWGA